MRGAKLRADEQEPDRRRCQAGRAGNREALVIKALAASTRRLCSEGVRSYPGRSRRVPERATAVPAREVSRARSSWSRGR
jgi:D-serine deaminase-like pyridoxal phosphate-dependent protein